MALIDTSGLEPFAHIIAEMYKDMAQPAARNVGLALGTITSIGLFLHLLSSWGTDRLNICLKNNLEQYAERIKDISPEQISETPPEIAIPIVEKLSYVSNEELRNLYIELLAKASIKDLNKKSHPSFVNIINNLSPDEAILLQILKNYPELRMSFFSQDIMLYRKGFDSINNNENFKKISYPENILAYLNNLESLGILIISKKDQSQYRFISEVNSFIRDSKRVLARNEISFPNFSFYGHLDSEDTVSLTEYGKLFISAIFFEENDNVLEEDS